MKKIAILAVMLVIVGAQATEDIYQNTDTLTYNYQKLAYGPEAINVLLGDVESSASFEAPVPGDGTGFTYGEIKNTLVSAGGTGYDVCDDPYLTQLTQGGNVDLSLITIEDCKTGDKNEIFTGEMVKWQDIIATGQYTNGECPEAYTATFSDEGEFGIEDVPSFETCTTYTGFKAIETSDANGKITVPVVTDCNSWVEFVNIGTKSGTDMTVTSQTTTPYCAEPCTCGSTPCTCEPCTSEPMTSITQPVMSGFTSSYAAFDEGYAPPCNEFETYADSTATHKWSYTY